MFNITVDVDALEKRVVDMLGKIDHFKRVDIGQQMSEWQSEELHRHKPFTMRSRAKGLATTIIRPHSLYEMLRSEGYALPLKQQRRAVRGLRSHLGHPLSRKFVRTLRSHRHWSTRPILRAEMEERLWAELLLLRDEKVKW
jgi:hypothetical protein